MSTGRRTRLREPGRPRNEPEDLRRLRRELDDRSRRLSENLLSLDNLLSPLDWLDAGDGFPGFGSWRWNRPVSRQQDRSHAPINYLNEEEWRLHVAMSRDLAARNHLTIGFVDHVTNFVGPTSVSFVLAGEAPGASASGPVDADGNGEPDVDPLVKQATAFWEQWRLFSHWGCGEHDREEECRRRLMLEGETTLRFFTGDDHSAGLPYTRHVEPELIRTPPGHTTLQPWGWGIKTAENDDEREEGLWVCRADDVSRGEVVESPEYVRQKRNVDRTVKRGLSDFFPVADVLRKVLGLHEAMAHVARLQASVAWWEQYPTATLDQVQTQIRQNADYSRAKLPPTNSGASTEVTSYEPGTIVRTESGRQVQPGPTSQPDGFGRVEEIVLRGVGFRFGTPSYFTGQGADAFASVLVTGSPFVRIMENRQGRQEAFACAVARRVLEFGERSGRLPKGIANRVRPVATSKPVVIADEEKKGRNFLSLYAQNCADPIEFIRSTGADPKVVAANIQAWKKKFPDQNGGGAPPGLPPGGPSPAPPGSAGGDGSNPPDDFSGLFGESKGGAGQSGDTFRRAGGLLLLTESDRAGLVRKQITNRAGHKQTVWVRPDDSTRDAGGADAGGAGVPGGGAAPAAAPAAPSPERRARQAAAAEHFLATAKERPQPKHLAAARQYADVARRRRVIHAVKNEGEVAAAIGGHNLPDSEPADVVHIVDQGGRPITDRDGVRAALRQREAALKTLATGKAHTVGPSGGLVASDQDATDEHRAFAQSVLARPAHFFEVKTLLTSTTGSVRMSKKALARKERWVDRFAVSFSTVAIDDRKGKKNSGHRVYVAPHELGQTTRVEHMKPLELNELLKAVTS